MHAILLTFLVALARGNERSFFEKDSIKHEEETQSRLHVLSKQWHMPHKSRNRAVEKSIFLAKSRLARGKHQAACRSSFLGKGKRCAVTARYVRVVFDCLFHDCDLFKALFNRYETLDDTIDFLLQARRRQYTKKK